MLKRKTEAEAQIAVVAFPDAKAAEGLSAQLDQAFGKGAWSSVAYAKGAKALKALDEEEHRFFLIGVQSDEEALLGEAIALIREARQAECRVILLAEALTPASMHAIMRAGADDFAPLPLPASALYDTVNRLRRESELAAAGVAAPRKRGEVFPVYAAAGGVGATTFAVNLAWETALEVEKSGRKVALLDFNFQYGSVATYLDLARREAIYEMLSDTSTMDEEGFGQTLTTFGGKLAVLTAPMDALPLDIIGPDDVRLLLELARSSFDFVFVDLPQTLAHWSDLVLSEADGFYAMMESDMRSAQNMLRFIRALKAEELPFEKVQVCLNRAPSFTDMSGKTRARRLEESLNITFAHRLPDGGKQVAAACDQGAPLAQAAKGNALRKEIRNVAKALLKASEATKSGKVI